MTGDRGDAGHEDWTESRARRLGNSSEFGAALPLQFVGKLHDQNSISRNKPDQSDQTNLGIDIQRRGPFVCEKRYVRVRHFQEGEEQRSKQRKRDRTKQDDERIAEAVELCREDEKDHHDSESERGEKFVTLSSQLT